MSSNMFKKHGLQYNHWVGNSVMKPVYAVVFQKIKARREGNNEESKIFEMEIFDKGALEKVLTVPGKTLDREKSGRQYEFIDDRYSKQLYFQFS